MKKRLLIITQAQFGSLIDYYQHSLNLKCKYEIEYICWDHNKQKVEIEGLKVYYIARKGNLIKRNFRFLSAVVNKIKSNSFDRILVNYFRGCFLLPLLLTCGNNLFLDIRTAGVQNYFLSRFFYNLFLRFECLFYTKLSVVSEGVKKRLILPKKTKIIPLGSNLINLKRPDKLGLHLLYIGTLTNRNIDQTLEGVRLFINNYKNVNLSFKIIGAGDNKSTEKLKKAIDKFNLREIVYLIDYTPHHELLSYLKESNIGVSYIPITNYYNYQPATKTYEYLMSGLPVIATSTFENRIIINKSNGVLIDDNPVSFCNGLSQIYESIYSYNAEFIKQNLLEYQWVNISNKLDAYLFD